MNAHILIDAVVQQTVVFIAQLATAGGVRAPLVRVADRIFLDLSTELHRQGVSKKVIADMFGMALRTYHRKVQAVRQSQTEKGRSVWDAVFEYIRENEPVAGAEIHDRFHHDDIEVVSGVLNDLVNSALVYRAGRGDTALYRAAAEGDLANVRQPGIDAWDWLVWLAVYRNGPATQADIERYARVPSDVCTAALERLEADGRVVANSDGAERTYTSERIEVPLGQTRGWEAAVLDHFQALVTAVTIKLSGGATEEDAQVVGGSTWSLDVGPGHPLRNEARETLARVRREVEALRNRIDEHNASTDRSEPRERVVFYAGQYVQRQ
jgi:DNA-binding MarR family transcriptional regulator